MPLRDSDLHDFWAADPVQFKFHPRLAPGDLDLVFKSPKFKVFKAQSHKQFASKTGFRSRQVSPSLDTSRWVPTGTILEAAARELS